MRDPVCTTLVARRPSARCEAGATKVTRIIGILGQLFEEMIVGISLQCNLVLIARITRKKQKIMPTYFFTFGHPVHLEKNLLTGISELSALSWFIDSLHNLCVFVQEYTVCFYITEAQTDIS